jgi:hypothetical protein
MTRFPSLAALAFLTSVSALACGGSEDDAGGGAPSDVGADVGGADARSDAGDSGALDTSVDAPVDAGGDAVADAPADAGSDAPIEVGDATSDAGAGLVFTLTANVFEDCMPIVASDPVHITGNLTMKNDTGATVGPITATAGTVSKPGSAPFGTFGLKSFTLPAIATGGSESGGYEKDAGTFSPASACTSIACGSSVVVELTLFGPGLPSGGVRVASPAVTNSCAL